MKISVYRSIFKNIHQEFPRKTSRILDKLRKRLKLSKHTIVCVIKNIKFSLFFLYFPVVCFSDKKTSQKTQLNNKIKGIPSTGKNNNDNTQGLRVGQ